MPFYFSERALNEMGTFTYTTTERRTLGFTRWIDFGRETTITTEAGPTEQVDLAIKAARRKRQVSRDPWDAMRVGSVIDVVVDHLEVGVMPFAYFGDYGEDRVTRGTVRAFWGHARLPPRAPIDSAGNRSLILLGSTDNVVNGSWARDREDTTKIGHNFPSDPSVLAELVRTELALDSADVDDHVHDIVTYEVNEPGDAALFAWDQTERATETRVYDDGYARTWQRRHPLTKARVVASVVDTYDSADDPAQLSVVLARPILIEDLT